ncbi:MAG: hypothetical protein K8T90_18905 [Planctomycetes bacterium]|nr:hypothetical protein [Planctomycetota bacterium]
MLRTRLFVAAVLAAALAAGSAHAVFDATSFAPLKAALEFHRDTDFTGTLTKTLKAQKAAVTKSLALIAKPATTPAKDIATALKVLKLLLKPYAGEFVVAQGKTATIGEVYGTLAAALTATIQTQRDALSARTPDLPESAGTRVHGLVGKADAALTAAADTGLPLKTRLAKLAVAAKLVAAGTKIADKASGGSGGAGLRATVDGTQLSDSGAQSEFYSGDNSLQIYGSFTLPGGVREAVYLLVKGVTGPGTYQLTAMNSAGNFQHVVTSPLSSTIYNLVPDSGSVTVQILQTGATKRVKATFSYSATHPMAGTKVITSGTHDVSGANVYTYTTNGF